MNPRNHCNLVAGCVHRPIHLLRWFLAIGVVWGGWSPVGAQPETTERESNQLLEWVISLALEGGGRVTIQLSPANPASHILDLRQALQYVLETPEFELSARQQERLRELEQRLADAPQRALQDAIRDGRIASPREANSLMQTLCEEFDAEIAKILLHHQQQLLDLQRQRRRWWTCGLDIALRRLDRSEGPRLEQDQKQRLDTLREEFLERVRKEKYARLEQLREAVLGVLDDGQRAPLAPVWAAYADFAAPPIEVIIGQLRWIEDNEPQHHRDPLHNLRLRPTMHFGGTIEFEYMRGEGQVVGVIQEACELPELAFSRQDLQQLLIAIQDPQSPIGQSMQHLQQRMAEYGRQMFEQKLSLDEGQKVIAELVAEADSLIWDTFLDALTDTQQRQLDFLLAVRESSVIGPLASLAGGKFGELAKISPRQVVRLRALAKEHADDLSRWLRREYSEFERELAAILTAQQNEVLREQFAVGTRGSLSVGMIELLLAPRVETRLPAK